MTFSELSEERTSDVGDLWARAIEDYVKTTGRDIKQVRHLNNTDAIRKEQEQELEKFKKFRHNGQTTDKLRHLVSKNSDLILSATKQVSAAASASFPPAGTILTAFTWVMKASKDVSADYDVILTFFDIQHSFLERISLLEARLPTVEAYQNILMRVFTSILNLCSIATKYEQEGRFLKWAKALYKGSDEKLKGALDGLNTNIQRLESATLFATLRQTMETSKSVASVGSAVNENLALTRQVNANLQETSAVVKETAMVGQQNFEVTQQIRTSQDKSHRELQKNFSMLTRAMADRQKPADQEQTKGEKTRKPKDAGARRSAALAQVRAALQTTASSALALADIKQTFVEGTFRWLAENETYKTFVDGEVEPLLWVTGDRGLGKSNLAYFAVRDLDETPHPLYTTTVAHFFFKEEHEELRSVVNLLKSVAIQVAEADNKYREEIANEVKKNADKWRDDDGTVLWERLFASKFPHESTSRLFLVIDGLDEADAADRKKFLELLGQIKRDELQIRVLFTSGPGTEGADGLEAATIPITISQLRKDLRMIIRARIKSLSRLRRLRVPVKKRITFKLQQKADSVLYVEHVLRRLNSLRREAAIGKELEKLPDNLSDLYNLLLAECQKGRSEEEFASLKRLFAWLAYSKRPLSLGEASNLVALVNEDAKLSLEEELEGKSARLLRLAQVGPEDEDSSDETDGDASETADEGLNEPDDTDYNTTAPLRFQERALRQYFREAIVDEKGLRSSPSSAHLIIFQTITTILTKESQKDAGVQMLKTYAADFWIPHFLDIQVDQVSDQEVKSVVESLAAIVTNQGRALEQVEECSSNLGIFGDATDLRENLFGALKSWLQRALSLQSDFLTPGTLQWALSLSENPVKLMEGIAEKHVFNWFNYAETRSEAFLSFQFAVRALQLTDILKEELKEVGDEFTPEQILKVADAFPTLEKSGFAYRGISLALKGYGHYKEGLDLSRKSLEHPKTDSQRFLAHISLGDAALTLAKQEEDKTKKAEYIKETKDAVNAASEMFASGGQLGDEQESKSMMLVSFLDLAHCVLLEDNIEAAIDIVKDQARPLFSEDYTEGDILHEIMAKLKEREDYERMMEFFNEFLDKDKIVWLAGSHETYQRAAVQSGRRDQVVETYESLIRLASQLYNTDFGFRYELARYHVSVLGNLERAKELLEQVLEDNLKGNGTVVEYTVLVSRSLLAEILMENFRSTFDAAEKERILQSMKDLAFPSSYIHIEDFDPYVSNTAIPAALMVRKMGPQFEFQKILSKSFDACIGALTDDEGWNDHNTIRFFGKVLACVSGLERDAQIALAGQFYFLNPDFKPQESDAGSEALDDERETPGASGEAADSAATPNPPVGAVTGKGDEVAGAETHEEDNSVKEANLESNEDDSLPQSDGDLNSDCSIFCNGCSKTTNGPQDGTMYTCIVCTDTDLCAECYNKRIGWNKGQPVTDWQTFCGKDHHYVKHPLEGWKGIKNGVIEIGEEKLEFKDWLEQVNERWRGAWEEFWKQEEGVKDVM